jgi:hypothetical protein
MHFRVNYYKPVSEAPGQDTNCSLTVYNSRFCNTGKRLLTIPLNFELKTQESYYQKRTLNSKKAQASYGLALYLFRGGD